MRILQPVFARTRCVFVRRSFPRGWAASKTIAATGARRGSELAFCLGCRPRNGCVLFSSLYESERAL